MKERDMVYLNPSSLRNDGNFLNPINILGEIVSIIPNDDKPICVCWYGVDGGFNTYNEQDLISL